VTRNDDDADIKQVVAADLDEIDRIEQPEAVTPDPTLIIGTQATPQPIPQPTPRPTPRPEPSDDEHHR